MSTTTIIVIIVALSLCGVLTALIGEHRGASAFRMFWFGACFGLLGLIVAAAWPKEELPGAQPRVRDEQ